MTHRFLGRVAALAVLAGTAAATLAPQQAQAWWHHPYGWHGGWHHRWWGPGPVVVVGRPVWIPAHWRYGTWIPGHWA
jgi:hypothetical protein